MNDMYMQNILDHYKSPENYGEMKEATVIKKEFNPFCGDKIQLYAKVEDEILVDVSFEGEGCAISQAAMSILSEEVKGKKVEEILAISSDDIVEMLGIELGPTRLKCALLGWQALQNAVKS